MIFCIMASVGFDWEETIEPRMTSMERSTMIAVESRPPKQGVNSTSENHLTGKINNSTNHCRCSDVGKNDTSLQNELVRRKVRSYLMAAKGLLNKVNDKVYRLDSLYSINLK